MSKQFLQLHVARCISSGVCLECCNAMHHATFDHKTPLSVLTVTVAYAAYCLFEI
jgi:hypothetical protein